jgi:uncharacterized protein
MRIFRMVGLVVLGLCVGEVAAEGPSFDCMQKELSSAEKLICSDNELTEMDKELNQVFQEAKKVDAKVVKGTLAAEQRGWIKGRNECWKESDLRACIKAAYLRRTSELQARYKLLSPVKVITYACDNNPAHELLVSFFATKQPSAVIEHGDDTFYLFEDAKDHYQGRNETLRVKGESVEFVPAYEAKPLSCVSQEPKKRSIDPTWDKDNDGLNDCEAEGICDHTVDYSKPRV